MSNVFEKDKWYLRPRVRSGSLIPPFCIRFGSWWPVDYRVNIYNGNS